MFLFCSISISSKSTECLAVLSVENETNKKTSANSSLLAEIENFCKIDKFLSQEILSVEKIGHEVQLLQAAKRCKISCGKYGKQQNLINKTGIFFI
jgi:hypothetical protein